MALKIKVLPKRLGKVKAKFIILSQTPLRFTILDRYFIFVLNLKTESPFSLRVLFILLFDFRFCFDVSIRKCFFLKDCSPKRALRKLD